ncbi:hypothetical protein [Teredinibacter turnerae]|uniref:hypothetical protein n=1 Tax=Teredinibacter turnerae TaxID=2426 RepID=UPI0030CBDA49
MADLHIDDFCRDTAKALVMLYNRFPQRTTVYVEDIAGPDQPDEFGLHSPRFTAGFHALLWLAETDYIRFSDVIRQEAVEDATLTHRSFLFLSGPASFSPPAGPADHPLDTRIAQIKDALATRSSDYLRTLMLELMAASRNHN